MSGAHPISHVYKRPHSPDCFRPQAITVSSECSFLPAPVPDLKGRAAQIEQQGAKGHAAERNNQNAIRVSIRVEYENCTFLLHNVFATRRFPLFNSSNA